MKRNKSEKQEPTDLMVGLNRFREILYLFLSRAFSREADRALLDDTLKILRVLEDLPDVTEIPRQEDIQEGKLLLKEFFEKTDQKDPDEVLADLSREYAASFLGVGEKTVALCESVYRGKTRSLFQESYFEVKERYAGIGLEKSEDFAEPEDHLSLELAYMATLCHLITESGENGGNRLDDLKAQLEFLQEHLMSWVPAFSRRLSEVNGSTFYQAWGHVLNGYLEVDFTLIDSLIQVLEKEHGAL